MLFERCAYRQSLQLRRLSGPHRLRDLPLRLRPGIAITTFKSGFGVFCACDRAPGESASFRVSASRRGVVVAFVSFGVFAMFGCPSWVYFVGVLRGCPSWVSFVGFLRGCPSSGPERPGPECPESPSALSPSAPLFDFWCPSEQLPHADFYQATLPRNLFVALETAQPFCRVRDRATFLSREETILPTNAPGLTASQTTLSSRSTVSSASRTSTAIRPRVQEHRRPYVSTRRSSSAVRVRKFKGIGVSRGGHRHHGL